jgi:hypothetical protein
VSVARTAAVDAGSPLATFARAWTGGDPLAVAALFQPAAQRHDVGFAEVARGRDEIAAAAGALMAAFGDLAVDLRPLDAGPHGWACEIVWSGIHHAPFRGSPGSRRRIEFSGLSIGWVGDDGLLAVEKWYSDGAALLRNLGGRC